MQSEGGGESREGKRCVSRKVNEKEWKINTSEIILDTRKLEGTKGKWRERKRKERKSELVKETKK